MTSVPSMERGQILLKYFKIPNGIFIPLEFVDFQPEKLINIQHSASIFMSITMWKS